MIEVSGDTPITTPLDSRIRAVALFLIHSITYFLRCFFSFFFILIIDILIFCLHNLYRYLKMIEKHMQLI